MLCGACHMLHSEHCVSCHSFCQWPFRKTRTMGTLASHAEIYVRVKAPGTAAEVRGVSPREKILRLYMQNPAI